MPERIQLSRRKGWRKPAGAIIVSRPSKWGNRFTVAPDAGDWCIMFVHPLGQYRLTKHTYPTRAEAVLNAVRLYRQSVEYAADDEGIEPDKFLEALTGHDLCCWCPPDQPCHADVLLELANP